MDCAGRSLSIVQNRVRQNCVWEGERRLVHRARQSRCIDARRTGLREMTQSPSHAPGFARTTFYSPLFVPFARVSLLSPTSPGSSHKFNAKVKTSTTRSRVGRDTRSLGEEVAVCVYVCLCSLSDRMLICWYRSSIVVVIIVVSFHRVFTFTFLSRIARAFSTGFFADARYVP